MSSMLPLPIILLLISHKSATAWQPAPTAGSEWQLRPGYLHVMVDIRRHEPPSDKLTNVQAAGVDCFLVSSSTPDSSGAVVIRDSQYRPISERTMEKSEREGDSMMMWEVSSLGDVKSAATEIGSNQQEAFVLSGDDAFVIHSMNNLPAEASCLWRPPSSIARSLLLLESSPISVWRLRSNPGILGMVLEWQDIVSVCQPPQQDWDAGQLYASLKKMRQPCSAMDYPPTIYMIGEDEVS